MEETGKKAFRACPHCNGLIRVFTNISIQKADDAERLDWRTGMAQEQIDLVESAERSGILKAFSETLIETRKHDVNPPKNIPKCFLDFLRLAVPRIVPKVCMDELLHTLGRSLPIAIYGAHNIAMVTSGGEIRWFVPYDLMRGKNATKIAGAKNKVRMPINEEEFIEWIRTKHGYVAGRGNMLDTMRNKSHGDFARLVQ